MSQHPAVSAPSAGRLSSLKLFVLVALRLAIGWHFLYEGIVKLLTPGWTSAPYLDSSRWILADLFQWIASKPIVLGVVDVLAVVDFANIWGLIVIGACLMLGLFTKVACLAGAFLLTLYYLAHPPLLGMDFGARAEGSYLVVDKNLIELVALVVIAFFPTGAFVGVDAILAGLWRKMRSPARGEAGEGDAPPAAARGVSLGRREILKGVVALPVVGAFVISVLKKRGWESYEERFLAGNGKGKVDALSGATLKTFNWTKLDELKGQVPRAPIGGRQFSRLILGGNLIGGWAHARDLIYVSKLVKAYHSDEKVFETLYLAEKCGINAVLTNPLLCRVINEYWRRDIGRIQFISDCGGADLLERVQFSVDNGAAACYVQGETADRLIREGNIQLVADALELTRRNKVPAGIGAHRIETIRACVEAGLSPDFWMKTLHRADYWSATDKEEEERDNIWCRRPQETIELMSKLPQPWIAFKTLAAGAFKPEEGFRYALEKGADFLCVGMYDFQLVDDVNIALDILASDFQKERPRPWIV